MDYWKETIESAFDEAGITATPGQIDLVAGAVEVSHENCGMAHGHDVASANWSASRDAEIERLKQELRDERDKVVCTECKGRGHVTESCGPVRSSTSTCFKCKGDGRL